MKYLIFLDIDETVMTRGVIHQRTVNAVRRAKEAGHKVYINTGRAFSIVPRKVIEEIDPDGLVCGIGTNIIIDGKVEFSRRMDDDLVKFLMNFAKKHSVRATIEGENHSASYCGTCFLGKDFEIFSFEEMNERFPDINVSKFVFERPLTDEEIKEVSGHVNVFNHKTYAEANLHGYTKASGMEFVQKKLGITTDHVIAIGDSVNDVDMLRAAGIAVVMGNATDEVKKLADFVTLPCSEGGVGYAIEKIIFEKQDLTL